MLLDSIPLNPPNFIFHIMKNSNISIVVLIGLPAAGKTSFCADFTENSSTGLVVKTFSYDKLCKDYSSSARKDVFKTVTADVNNCSKVDKQFVFLIDDNMYYKSMRREYLNLARRHQTGFLQIYFDISVISALARNSTRVYDRVPDHVITRMFEKLQLPKDNFIIINSELPVSNQTFADVKNRVLDSFEFPLRDRVSVSQPVEIGELQKIDLSLRKLVGVNVSKNPRFAEMYNKIKSVLFRNIKNGHVDVSLFSGENLIQFLNDFFVL